MAKKPVLKTYSVTGRIDKLDVAIEIEAASLEEALTKAKGKKFVDFVDSPGDVYDYEGPEIRSIWQND
jgi:hypothetical protein